MPGKQTNTPNESQLHKKIKSQPQKNWRLHKVGITCDKYTEANFSLNLQRRHTIIKFHQCAWSTVWDEMWMNTTFLLPFILCTSRTECLKIKILWIKVSPLKLYRNNELSTLSSAHCKTCRGNLSYSRLATAKLLEAVLTSMKLGLSLFLQLNDGSVHSCISSLCTRWHPWCVWPVTIRRGFNISISWKSQQSSDTRTETGILCSG